jgi:rRNA processing protein Gar1
MVRNADTPPLKSPVLNKEGKAVGSVVKIIGATRNPYILVKGEAEKGDDLYI